jgi:hypothetical protein
MQSGLTLLRYSICLPIVLHLLSFHCSDWHLSDIAPVISFFELHYVASHINKSVRSSHGILFVHRLMCASWIYDIVLWDGFKENDD